MDTYDLEDLETRVAKLYHIIAKEGPQYDILPALHYKSLRYMLFNVPEKRSSLQIYFKRTVAKVYVK